MGCVSSKQVKKELRKEEKEKCITHVVSLTSSTYGLLKLDKSPDKKDEKQEINETIKGQNGELTKKKSPPRESFEVINTWELMKDLEEEEETKRVSIVSDKKSPKSRPFLQTPKKFFNQIASPKRAKKSGGKENKGLYNGFNSFSPKNRCVNSAPNLSKRAQSDEKCDLSRVGNLSKRRSLSPLFGVFDKDLKKEDPVEVSENKGAKRVLNMKNHSSVLDSFERKCPRGGEDSVVIYTTTLRGIRKTFEECNNVRSIVESYGIQVFERDVSMDSSFKEDLRELMGTKAVKVPALFVKGRLIGGANEVIKMEEEGKLGVLFDGIPSAVATCTRCGGVRFVMCLGCNGSCKVLGDDKKKKTKCGKCNENGLIQCPVCC